MKFAFVVLSSLIAFSSYADKVKLDIKVTQTYVVNAQNSNRYDLQKSNIYLKMSAKIDGQRANAEKEINVAADGSYMIIGSDEITQFDKAGKQTILAARVSDSRITFTEVNADQVMTSLKVQGGTAKTSVSKTECTKDSTSLMTCKMSIAATVKVH